MTFVQPTGGVRGSVHCGRSGGFIEGRGGFHFRIMATTTRYQAAVSETALTGDLTL